MYLFSLFFFFRTFSKEIIYILPSLKIAVTLALAFFSDVIKARSFKLCMVVTLLWIYIVIVSLMTLTLFQGYRCVRNVNCKLCFGFLPSVV